MVTFRASNFAGTYIERHFYHGNRSWNVHHIDYRVPVTNQNSGNAKRMLRASFEAYDNLDLTMVDLRAGGLAGGYAWAKAGFIAADVQLERANLLRRAAPLDPAEHAIAVGVIMNSHPGDLLYNVANLTNGQPPLGKRLLLRSSWRGSLDLTDTEHRRRVATYLR